VSNAQIHSGEPCDVKISAQQIFSADRPIVTSPVAFLPDLVPENKLLHRGVFSPDMRKYFYTLSDRQFSHFDVYMVDIVEGIRSAPREAFFNTGYNEHGMAFSPDGTSLYFSSTRPVEQPGTAATWHIWRTVRCNGVWSEPVFVDIPNLRDKLVSHPSVTSDGTLYYHSAGLDYRDMCIYCSDQSGGTFSAGIKLPPSINHPGRIQCTPHVSPDGSYLLFEMVPDICFSTKTGSGVWSPAKPLCAEINVNGRGNPYVTPDERHLFFVSAENPTPGEHERWLAYRVSTDSFLQIQP